MPYNFDSMIERRDTNCIKWRQYPQDVLPLWVADMDFAAPEPIRKALQCTLEHGVLGYESPTRELRETVAARMQTLYGWQVSPEAVVATPGVVAGFTAAAHTPLHGRAGDPGPAAGLPAFPESSRGRRMDPPGCRRWCWKRALPLYDIGWIWMFSRKRSTPAERRPACSCSAIPTTRPGRSIPRDELARMADICLKNDVSICSDEIHSEILLDGANHIPIAALDPEIADRTITLVAPSKTFNVPGLFCGFAIIPNPDLLGTLQADG